MDGHKRQKEQSRQMIQAALFELMKEKCFAQITVSEIVKRADVARRTFYRLYESKEQVLCMYLQELCQEYCRSCKPLEGYDLEQIAKEYFCFWYQYRDFLKLMQSSGMDSLLYYEISRTSREVVKKRISSPELKNIPGVEYFISYSSGGFLNLLYQWIQEGMPGPAEAYAKEVSQCLEKFWRGNTGFEKGF